MTFFEGSESLIDPDSEMTVEVMSVPANKPFDIKLRVVLGSTWHSVQKFFGAESRYEVDTPSATLVARGTMWWVNVDKDGRTQAKVLEGKVDMHGDYTIGIPGNWPADHPVRRFSSEITRMEQSPQATPTPAPSKNLVQQPRDDERTAVKTKIGLGVLAQAFFIAQSMQSQLAPEQMAELVRQVGCHDTCTTDDLVRAHREKSASWGDIKKWVDDHRSLGDIRSGREEGPFRLAAQNRRSGDDSGGNGNDKGNGGGNGNDKGGGGGNGNDKGGGGGNGNDKDGGGHGNDKGGGGGHGNDKGEGGHRR